MRGELEGVLRCFVPEWTGLGSVSSPSLQPGTELS